MVAVALSKAADFICVGALPKRSFATLAELAVLSEFSGVGIKGVAVVGEVSRRGGVRGACRCENHGAGGGGYVS